MNAMVNDFLEGLSKGVDSKAVKHWVNAGMRLANDGKLRTRRFDFSGCSLEDEDLQVEDDVYEDREILNTLIKSQKIGF